MFAWRVCRKALPTKERLSSKGIDTDRCCYLCGERSETTCHLFFQCPYLLNAAHQAIPSCVLPNVQEENWVDVFFHSSKNCNFNQLGLLLVVWNQVWTARNVAWLGKRVPPSIETGKNAVQLFNAFCQEDTPSVATTQLQRNLNWQPALENWYKVNVDATISTNLNITGLGVVVRDSPGMFMAARAMINEGCFDPHRAELLAAREGIIFARDARFRQIILEGDARNVYSSLENSEEDLSYNGSIIRDIALFASWFYAFKCSVIPRDCNRCADFVARKAIRGDIGIWLEDP